MPPRVTATRPGSRALAPKPIRDASNWAPSKYTTNDLALISAETVKINATIPDRCPEALHGSICYKGGNMPPPLNPANCPKFRLLPTEDEGIYPQYGTRIQVINADTNETAIALSEGLDRNEPHVAIFNFANAYGKGGGWKNGARAQEEFLFYRSDFDSTLDQRDYPILGVAGNYSPTVAIHRSTDETGYKILEPPYPLVAGITIAALNGPTVAEMQSQYGYAPEGYVYGDPKQAEETRNKIRLCLRIAAHHGHTRIVLGAFGCGAFANPSERVAEMFLHTFMEEEFTGGWWEHVVFAVKNAPTRDGWGTDRAPFDPFWRILQGAIV